MRAADALAVGSDANSITNLSADGDIQNPDPVAKATTAYLKLRFDGQGHLFQAGWGKRRRDYHLYADNNTRILPARDYIDATFLKLSREFAMTANSSIAVALAHGNQRDGGDLFEEQGVSGFYPAEDDHDASFNEISVTWHRGGHYAGVSFTNVYGSHHDRVLFAGDYGTWDSEADGYTGFSRREFLSFLKYRFPGQLRGLSLAWLHVNFETRGQVGPDSNKELTFGPAGFITHDADRIYLTYTHEL